VKSVIQNTFLTRQINNVICVIKYIMIAQIVPRLVKDALNA